MGKQGPRPNSQSFDASSGMKEYELRWSEMLLNGDPSRGRRMSGWDKAMLVKGFKNGYAKYSATSRGAYAGKRHLWWLHRHMRSLIFTFALLGFFFLLDSFMFSYFDPTFLNNAPTPTQAYAPEVYNSSCLFHFM